ncbi:probable G-protein coupled receptor 139 [Teleopsis dalmanni]|uniref:probable G-protein coupled receptor 139 n=1 Tax=Teleopsis dalmanni TaxID=139649 RepID=UPI0018CD00E6|nr:probable G-protein coupled receptor 139 [Teleopsis dalmanni]
MTAMAANVSESIYCGSGVDNFHTSYKHWHGYVSLVVCILGTIANTLNIIVLSGRDMRSPTNAILTGLAVADLAVMIEYMPYTIHDYILGDRLPREQQVSFAWACFVKFHSIFAQVLHTISIWLTVTLAVWRYIAVGYPQKNRVWCGMRTTLITIITAYIVCLLVVSPSLYIITAIAEFLEKLDIHGKTIDSIPLSQYVIDFKAEMANKTKSEAVIAASTASTGNVSKLLMITDTNIITTASDIISTTTTATLAAISDMSTTIGAATTTETSPTSAVYREVIVYRLFHSDLALRNKWVLNATFLIYSVLIKLIPCIALTIFSVRLIAALLEAKRRRKKLTSNSANGMKPIVNGKTVERPRKNSRTLEKEKQTDRTTRMLLAVLLLFLITEFPQGIMGLLNTVLGDQFYSECYLKLSDLMDILALINSSINFILYCSMSKQFRTTFTLLFRPKFLDKWLPVAQDEDGVGGRGGRVHADMASKSAAVEQQYMVTQVTNV